MAAVTQPQVLESALRWSDGRRIFMGQSVADGQMLFRMEADPLAVDESVLAKIDELEAAMVAAFRAQQNRAALILHKAS